LVVQPGGIRQPDDQALGGGDSGDGLAPRLGARRTEQSHASRVPEPLRYRVRAFHFELDADPRDGDALGPRCRPEARLGGLRQRPDTEVLAAGNLLAGEVVPIEPLERQPQRVDVELPARRGSGAMMLTLAMNCTFMALTFRVVAGCARASWLVGGPIIQTLRIHF